MHVHKSHPHHSYVNRLKVKARPRRASSRSTETLEHTSSRLIQAAEAIKMSRKHLKNHSASVNQGRAARHVG